MEEKITKRMSYEAILEIVQGTDTENKDMLVEFVEKQIELIDNRAEKAKERAAAKRAEGDALRETVKSVLTSELQTADAIAEQIEDEEISVAKVRARLTQLVNNGDAVKEDIKSEDGKTKKAYRLA